MCIPNVMFSLGKLVIIAAVCVSCRGLATPEATPFKASPKEYPSAVPAQASQNLSWEDYFKLYAISESAIAKIAIEYQYLGLREIIDHSFVIEAAGADYQTEDGKTIPAAKVNDLANAMVNLRRSGGLISCWNHFDDYPRFRVEIEYASGHKAILSTTTNCNSQRIPWNIVYDDALYFQGTGEIPTALYNLLAAFAVDLDEWWTPALIATIYTGGGSTFQLNSRQLPPEIKNPQFSVEEIFRQALLESGELDDYLTQYEFESIDLYCAMFSDCTVVEGKVKLKSQSGALFIIDARFNDGVKLQIDHVVPVAQLIEIGSDIETSNLMRQAQNAKEDLAITIYCWQEPACKDLLWCATAYRSMNENPPAESLVCLVDFILGYVTSLVYFPDHGQFWVRQLLHDFYEAPSAQWQLELAPVSELFQVPGFEKITEDIGSSFFFFSDEEKCNRIRLVFESDKVDTVEVQNPGYIDDYIDLLKEKVQPQEVSQLGITIDILGYCLFANRDGDFRYVQP